MRETDREIRVQCDCHDRLHFVEFSYMEWDDPYDFDINATIVSNTASGFWGRLRLALDYVFFRQRIVTADVVLSPEKADEIAAFLHGLPPVARLNAERETP